MRFLSTNQAQKEKIINENTIALEPGSIFGWRVQNTEGLEYAYWGGFYQNKNGVTTEIDEGSVTLVANETNYIILDTQTLTVFSNTTGPEVGDIPLAIVETDTTKIIDHKNQRIFSLMPLGVSNNFSTLYYEDTIPVTGNLSKVNTIISEDNITTDSFRYEAYLRCLTTEFGYAVDDMINITTGPVGGAEYGPATILGNAESCSVILGAAVKAQRLTATVGLFVDLTPANWEIVIRIFSLR